MALPDLNWKFVGTRAIGYNLTMSNMLDGIWTLGTSLVYADGTSRIGSPSAWSWGKQTTGSTVVAAYGSPPINPLEMRYIVGGSATAGALPVARIASPDNGAFQTNTLYYGMNRQSGAFVGWDQANPFTNAGGFSGYWAGIPAVGANSPFSYILMWESQEAVALQIISYLGDSCAIVMGALFDPLSYQTGISCETDGRLYYMYGSGTVTRMETDWLSLTGATNEQVLGGHSGTANQYHGGYFLPGTNTLKTTARFGNLFPTDALLSMNNNYPLIPFSALDSVSGNFIGQSRNFYMIRDLRCGYDLRVGTRNVGSMFAANITTSTDTILFARG